MCIALQNYFIEIMEVIVYLFFLNFMYYVKKATEQIPALNINSLLVRIAFVTLKNWTAFSL